MSQERAELYLYRPQIREAVKNDDGFTIPAVTGNPPINITEPFDGFPEELLPLRMFIDVEKIHENGFQYSYSAERWMKKGKFSKPPTIIPIIDQLLLDTIPTHTRGDSASFSEYCDSLVSLVKEMHVCSSEESIKISTHSWRSNGRYYPRFSLYKDNNVSSDVRNKASAIRYFVMYLRQIMGMTRVASFKKLLAVTTMKTDLAPIFKLDECDRETVESLSVPQVSEDEAKNLVESARHEWRLPTWVRDRPSISEFTTDNTEMVERVVQHCSIIPGFKLTYLRFRDTVVYVSDGEFRFSPEAINSCLDGDGVTQPSTDTIGLKKMEYVKMPRSSSGAFHDPILYMGPSWSLYFTIMDGNKEIDGLDGNEVHIVTGQMWTDAMKQHRPDLLETWAPNPDEIYVVCTHWCQRNNGYVKENIGGIDLYNLHRRRTTLAEWILVDFQSRCHAHGVKMPFNKGRADGSVNKKKLQMINDYINSSKAFEEAYLK